MSETVQRMTAAVPLGRRRPSGEPPPLPRRVSRSTGVFVFLGIAVLALWIGLLNDTVMRLVTRGDSAVLHLIADVRVGPMTAVMRAVRQLGSPWLFRVLAWATLLVLVVVRRFQHLFTYLAVLLVVTSVDLIAAIEIGRMRPTGVDILAPWDGYSHPSRPIAALGLALVAVAFTLAPPGVWRARVVAVSTCAIVALAAARLYLAVDHPTDVAAALVIGVALPVVAFRLLVPDDVFPITYRRGVRAHVDVSGDRGVAIARALRDQLRLEVQSLQPFGLHASSGSTPLRICVRDQGGQERDIFGKLYTLSHLRSDWWYKLARTVLYGRLEGERPFSGVRRLVEYEDYMLRVMRDAGLSSPEPYGVVEISPEREYVLVMDFLDGVRCSEADVDDAVMDDALVVVRRMWDHGLAHRDIKPANLLVRGERVALIDVAFAAVRPSPWRQAVDLANMMMTLALSSTPERVYDRTLHQFSAEDVAEAFAASRSVTIPSELRSALTADGRDIQTCFRRLAPTRPRIAIQRWSLRRVGLTIAVLCAALAAIVLLIANLQLAGLL
jgi:tRNA A-37 threonylcarbamoyl transferase component Bud32